MRIYLPGAQYPAGETFTVLRHDGLTGYPTGTVSGIEYRLDESHKGIWLHDYSMEVVGMSRVRLRTTGGSRL